MENPLKHNLKKHFREHRLSAEQLEKLNQVQIEGKRENWRGRRTLFAFAVILLIIVAVWRLPSQTSLSSRIAAEIATNHLKRVPSEINSDSLQSVQEYLNRIDFALIESSQLTANRWKLLGGRYCSIQGKLAVQLKMRNKQDNLLHTLYQVPFPITGIDEEHLPQEIFVDGAKVKLWREKDLLLGLVKTD